MKKGARRIRLHTYDPLDVSAEEFAALFAEMNARRLSDDIGLAEQIVAKLLSEHFSRYWEVREQEAHDPECGPVACTEEKPCKTCEARKEWLNINDPRIS